MDDSEKIVNYFEEQWKFLSTEKEKANDKMLNHGIRNISEFRMLFNQIALISSSVIILISLVDKNQFIEKNFLATGVLIYFFIIILTFTYLSERLSVENENIVKVSNDSKNILLERQLILKKYLVKQSPTDQDKKNYETEFKNSWGNKVIEKEREEQLNLCNKKREKALDYFSELIIFLFSTASFFIVLSLKLVSLSVLEIILLVLLIFVIIFSKFLMYLLKYFNKIIFSIEVFCKKNK
jgi:hypothetical protein